MFAPGFDVKQLEANVFYAGTPIPSHLILIHEFMSRFSLRPSRGTALKGERTAIHATGKLD